MRDLLRWTLIGALVWGSGPTVAEELAARPTPQSLSVLAFAPDGALLIGDTRQGAIFAVDLGARTRPTAIQPLDIADVETKVAALIGTRAADVMIHDLAVDPISADVYLAVSRNRGGQGAWDLPNHAGDATELIKISANPGGPIWSGVDLTSLPRQFALLPKALLPGQRTAPRSQRDMRVDAITDLAWDEGQIWVAGLSNEEFSSAIWRVPYPLTGSTAGITTVENFHVSHRKWETAAPVRTLLPLTLSGKRYLLAAYLCTPLVLYATDELQDGAHVRGRTIAELGSLNYPLDLVHHQAISGNRIFLANSTLPLMTIEVAAIESFSLSLTEPPGGYVAGLPAEYRPVTASQLEVRGDRLMVLRRALNGSLELKAWFGF